MKNNISKKYITGIFFVFILMSLIVLTYFVKYPITAGESDDGEWELILAEYKGLLLNNEGMYPEKPYIFKTGEYSSLYLKYNGSLEEYDGIMSIDVASEKNNGKIYHEEYDRIKQEESKQMTDCVDEIEFRLPEKRYGLGKEERFIDIDEIVEIDEFDDGAYKEEGGYWRNLDILILQINWIENGKPKTSKVNLEIEAARLRSWEFLSYRHGWL